MLEELDTRLPEGSGLAGPESRQEQRNRWISTHFGSGDMDYYDQKGSDPIRMMMMRHIYAVVFQPLYIV